MTTRWYAGAIFAAMTTAGTMAGCGEDKPQQPEAASGCPAGLQSCGGVCIDTAQSDSHCGQCSAACGANGYCAAGACVCPTGLQACASGCVDVAGDPANCGSCGMACALGSVCALGQCTTDGCPANLTACNGGCVDVSSSPLNCGGCGASCVGSQSCVAGVCTCAAGQTLCGDACIDLQTSALHCGGCNLSCGAGQSCVSGACTGGTTGGMLTSTSSSTSSATTTTGATGTTGATSSTGPATNTTGTSNTSGTATTAATTGGAGGATGSSTTEGTPATSGTTGGTTGPCSRSVGSCSAPEVSVTEIDVGVQIVSYGSEYDTQPVPMAIAAMPSGGSRVAWLGTDGNAYVAELDCDDQMVGSPISFPASDIQDLYADDTGGVLLMTREATGSGEHNCGPGPLCGGTSAQCYDMYLMRFNENGTEEWASKVTNLSDSMEGYDNGARFVWGHYQHHGRIAFDGSNFAAYFCIGITTQNGSCVDIHEGDRMQVVSASGAQVNHEQEFEVGCSHSWTTRIVWDPRSSEFVTVCATDRPANGAPCQIARSPGYQTLAQVQCNGQFWGGDVVLASNEGYWTAYTQQGSINLVHFTDSGPDDTIDNAGSADHAKLVSYGENHMLLAWESGSSMAAKVLDSASGATVGTQFSIDVEDHNYHAFKAFPDGSAAYPAAGSNNTSIRIARVMPCQ